MANCKCKSRPKIVSDTVRAINDCGCCNDVCTNPVYGEPSNLSLMAPLIYDEIGINLCATFDIGTDIATTYPTATNANIKAISAAYTYGAGNVEIEPIPGRPNCTRVTLSNITVTFALRLYDASCRLLATLYPTAVYLPTDATAPTYDEDTNPSSVELELYTPYGVSYDTTGATPTPAVNYVGETTTSNTITQGVNLYGRAKLLDFNIPDSSVTVGLTLVLQSLYFAGYRVKSEGKIDTPKGNIISPENSDCMRFVAGDLLDLAIRPLDLGGTANEQCMKKDCNPNTSQCGV